jgi:amino acid adenylation domain-containing protein
VTTTADLSSPTHAVPLGAVPASSALAALVAVLHRVTLRDALRVGYCSATAAGVLTLDLSDDPSAVELLRRVERDVATLSKPDEDVLRELVDAELDLRCEAGPMPTTGAPDLTTSAASIPVLGVGPEGVWLAGGVPGVMDTEALVRLVRTALCGLTAEPLRVLSGLELADDGARAQVAAWGGTGIAPLPPRSIPDLVRAQADRTPDAVAVSASGSTLTYRELTGRAAATAARLAAAGVRRGDVVGVLGQRSVHLISSLLGVLEAGAAYLALDVEAPEARLAALLADAGARVALAPSTSRHRLPDGLAVLPLAGPATPPAGWQPVPVCPDDIAYVSYTSGSTGEPKGVAVPHRSVARLVGPGDWLHLTERDVVLQLAPVAFDASTLEIWGPLATGGRLAVYPAGPVAADLLARMLCDEGVTVAWLTSGLFHQMVGTQLPAFAGLRHVLAGGDVIKRDHVRRLLRTHPALTFTNGYGPTENTTFTTCWTSSTPPAGRTVPIGRPIAGTSVLVLDREQRPTAVGVPGELYTGGAGLARGYLGRPAATAAAFLPDPRPDHPGERLYRTGDLVRWLPDGTLEFLGRADHQVKVNGYRVELGEVEAAIGRDRRVRDAVVLAQPDSAGGKRLLAYVSLREDAGGQAIAEVRDALRDHLPTYMVPWAIIGLPRMPLNRNGKVDRSALPAAHRLPRALAGDYVPPRTPWQAYLTELWGDVLGLEPIGVEDDFFELGGHSLMAGELITRLQEELSLELSAQTLYLRPTIAELAETLEQHEDRKVQP